jgi:Family of unknown function (DUF5335)
VMQDQGEISRPSWAEALELLTKEHEGAEVTIEVVNQDFGDLVEAEKIPLAYLQYDHKDDAVIVAVGGRSGRYPVMLRHIIFHPTAIRRVQPRSSGGAHAIVIAGPDGDETLVTLHRGAAGA